VKNALDLTYCGSANLLTQTDGLFLIKAITGGVMVAIENVGRISIIAKKKQGAIGSPVGQWVYAQ
jgi:hypothetical protein